VLDGETLEVKGNWENECEVPLSGYDFWYQPRHNVLISTAGLVPKCAGRGFDPNDLKKGEATGTQVLSQHSRGCWERVGGSDREDRQSSARPARLMGTAAGRAAPVLTTGRSLSVPAAPRVPAVALLVLAGCWRGCPCL